MSNEWATVPLFLSPAALPARLQKQHRWLALAILGSRRGGERVDEARVYAGPPIGRWRRPGPCCAQPLVWPRAAKYCDRRLCRVLPPRVGRGHACEHRGCGAARAPRPRAATAPSCFCRLWCDASDGQRKSLDLSLGLANYSRRRWGQIMAIYLRRTH